MSDGGHIQDILPVEKSAVSTLKERPFQKPLLKKNFLEQTQTKMQTIQARHRRLPYSNLYVKSIDRIQAQHNPLKNTGVNQSIQQFNNFLGEAAQIGQASFMTKRTQQTGLRFSKRNQ